MIRIYESYANLQMRESHCRSMNEAKDLRPVIVSKHKSSFILSVVVGLDKYI